MQKLSIMPTRIIGVLMVAVFFSALYMGLWFIIQPMLTYIAIAINDMLTGQSLNTTETDNIITLMRLVIDIFLLIPIAGLWIWAYNKAQEREWAGYPR